MKESFPPDNTQHPQQWSINSLQPPPLSNTSRHHSSSLPLIRFTAVCQDNKAIVYPLIIQRAIHSPGSQTDPSTQIYDTYTTGSSMHFILFLIICKTFSFWKFQMSRVKYFLLHVLIDFILT